MNKIETLSEIQQKGKKAKAVSRILGTLTTEQKNEALRLIANQLKADESFLIEENKKDLQAGKEHNIPEEMLDRLMLDADRIDAIANGISELIELVDPVGETIESLEKENGLSIVKKRVPLGVVGMIYEARPNVTVDAATLSLKTGNAAILRGSSSAKFSNLAIVQSIHKALEKSDVPVDAVQLIEDTSRESAKELFTLNEYLDVLIPRGGSKLIETVVKESTVPVIETGAGNCHLFIDKEYPFDNALDIVLNAKLQRPSVCNAIETLIVHEDWLQQHGSAILSELLQRDVIIHGDEKVSVLEDTVKKATEEDWETEYLGPEISIKAVSNVEEAIAHINEYGTQHSESILTNNEENAVRFLNEVDASSVYHNVSTRFTDGFEFGYGAEIGISTQKLHARGPMGLQALTSSKFVIQGNGQVRP